MHRVFLMTATALAFAIATVFTVSTAEAGWPHRGRGCAGSDGGSYGSAGGSAGDAGSHGGGSHGGGSQGGRHGWRSRRNGSDGGSAGGSYGGSAGGSYGGSYGGSAGGSYGGSAGGTLVVTPELAKHVPVSNDAVLLTVEVPRDAKVWINKYETGSTGETRLFTSNGMTAEKKYDFIVRMRAYIDGKWVDKTKKVALEAGERETVSLAKVLEEEAAAQAKAPPAASPPATATAAKS